MEYEGKTLTVGSLFSGIGGFDVGLERAGMRVIWQSEIDPYASAVLRKRWPHVPNHGDIRTIDAGIAERPDLICGGFPCQPFSLAGKRRGAEDDRHLWPEMLRVIAALRPAWVVGENVAGIVRMELDQVLSDLDALGYATQTFAIPAAGVDAPHRRERIWIIAHRDDGQRDEQDEALRARGNAASLLRDLDSDRKPARAVDDETSRMRCDVADADEQRSQRWLGAIMCERAGKCAIGDGGAFSHATKQRSIECGG